jgi:hypothetical protein
MEQNLFVIQTVFAGIAAIAILGQAVILYAVYRAIHSMSKGILDVLPKVESMSQATSAMVPKLEDLMAVTKVTIEESRKLVALAQEDLAKVDSLVTEAATRARAQMDRVEMVLDETLDKAQNTVNVVTNGVLRPVREIQGVAAGIQAAFAYLLNSSRPSVDRVTSDEEMFI